MIALDTSFLLDYLDGVDAAAKYLYAHEGAPFHAPSLSLFEVYRWAARSGGAEQIERVTSALGWVDPLPVDDAAVREATLVEAELHDAGAPINLGDVLIAGVCRQHGARIVTRDVDFERVPDFGVESY